jgi:hypothetical protein
MAGKQMASFSRQGQVLQTRQTAWVINEGLAFEETLKNTFDGQVSSMIYLVNTCKYW